MLSSIYKLSRYAGLIYDAGNERLTNRQKLLGWQAAVSNLVETYCHRRFIIESRTELFDVTPQQKSFRPMGVPLVSITSVKADTEGRYDGTSDYTLDSGDYRIGTDSMSLVVGYPVTPGLGALQIVSTGGLAYHAVRSVFAGTVTGVTNGWYCTNATGTAVGIVRANSATSIAIENLYGYFEGTDVLSFATKEESLFDANSLQSSASATLTSCTQRGLSEAYPDLERAVEIEVRYMAQHQRDFENVSTLQDQTQRRQHTFFQKEYVFQPETLAILGRYRRIIL
jgi:hypothetical protein